MRPRIVWIIFRKEITETLRDRRTLLMMIGLPILLYPLLLIGLTKLQRTHIEAQEGRPSTAAIWGEVETELSSWLRDRPNLLDIKPWAGAPESLQRQLQAGELSPPPTHRIDEDKDNPLIAAARQVVAGRQVDAVLVVWPGFASALAEGGLGAVSIYFDSVREGSGKAQERLREEVAEFRKMQVQRREQEHGLMEGFSTAVQIGVLNVAAPARQLGQILGSILPILLIIISASGGLYAAIDLTAGEKERNTMQTLLCAPLHYTEIIGGKFLAAWTIVLLAALANMISLAATFTRVVLPLGDFTVPPSTYFLTFTILLPVTFMITALFLAVAVFAKDFKDGQNFLNPVMLVLIVPLGATMLPGVELNIWTAFVPIINVALLIKALFIGEAEAELAFLTVISSIVYAALALLFAARVFYREQVLLGGKQPVRSVFQMERIKGGLPTPGLALTAFALMFVLLFYGTYWLQERSLISMVLVTQYGFFLLPAVLLAVFMRFSPRETFSLRIPHWRGVLAAVLMGLSAWTVAAGILIRFLPPPDSLVEALEKMLLLGGEPMPLWTLLLVLAVTPAICEEVFFRGLVFSGLRRLGVAPAIFISALLFGLAHSSIYRLLPTLFLGVLFGFILWRTGSILCAMIVHALNNGFAVTLLHLRSATDPIEFSEPYLPWHLTLVGIGVLAVSIWLLQSIPRPAEHSPPAPSNVGPTLNLPVER